METPRVADPGGTPRDTAGSSPQRAAGDPERLRSLLQLVGSVVAPTTLLTALLFYFGWAHAYWFFHHFGIDISLLGLTTQDYVMRSVDALFVPLTVVLSVGALLLWGHRRVTARLFAGPDREKRLRRSAMAVAMAGLILFGVGMAGIFVRAVRETYHLALPLSLGTGTLLLFSASRLQRRSDTSETSPMRSTAALEATAVFLLVTLSLFWAATNYAARVGGSRAREYEREFRNDQPEAILYSKERLHLKAPGVHEVSCAEPEGGYRYRYQGLRLMLRSAEQYFFLPELWSPSDGVAIIVPEGDSVRLEFAVSTIGERPRADGAAGTC